MTLSGHHARGADDQVHVLVDDSAVPGSPSHRTLCGRAVLVVYEHQVRTTCPECCRKSAARNQAPASYEPCG